jgi:hypothetical protein
MVEENLGDSRSRTSNLGTHSVWGDIYVVERLPTRSHRGRLPFSL